MNGRRVSIRTVTVLLAASVVLPLSGALTRASSHVPALSSARVGPRLPALAGTATPSPTPTKTPVVPSPSPTATATPATPLPSPTPTMQPPTPEETMTPTVFRVYGVKVQPNARPDWGQRRPGLKDVRRGQKVVLAIYVHAQQMPTSSTISYAWGVRKDGRLVAHHGRHFTLEAPGYSWLWWTHTFGRAGIYRFTGTATINGVRHHRSTMFAVRG